jgi:hypothetical protein
MFGRIVDLHYTSTSSGTTYTLHRATYDYAADGKPI